MALHKYWIRTTVGLEQVVLRELSAKLAVQTSDTRHRSVFVESAEKVSANELCTSLRTADDIYHFIGAVGGIDKTKQSVQKIEQYFVRDMMSLIPRTGQVRVTASFLGQRNFNRYYIENHLNNIIKEGSTAAVLSNEGGDKWTPGETRIRLHIEDDQCYFGIGLQDKPLHRRPWRNESYTAQLHPPLAAAMSMILAPPPGMQVIDPFCGSGTILIESALQHTGVHHIGYDTDTSAITIAGQNADSAGVSILFNNDDFAAHYKTAGKYMIASNPPWGEKHSIDDERFLKNLHDIIANSVAAVLIVPEEIKSALHLKGASANEICVTRVRGKLASILHIIPSS